MIVPKDHQDQRVTRRDELELTQFDGQGKSGFLIVVDGMIVSSRSIVELSSAQDGPVG